MNPRYIKKSILFAFLVSILFISEKVCAQTQLGNTLLSTEKYDGTGDAVAMSGNGNRIVFSANRVPKNNIQRAGEIKVYELQGGNWVQLGSTISGIQEREELGTSVDISDDGNRIAFSGEFGAKVYDFQNGNWQLNADYSAFPEFSEASGGARRVRFADNGKILAIADEGFDNELVVVYEEANGSWQKKGNPIARSSETSSFSFALSKNGNRLAIPRGFEVQLNPQSWQDFENLLIYDFENNDWVQNYTIMISDSLQIANSGVASVILSDGFDFSANGNQFVFMASNDDRVEDEGFLFTYAFENGQWSPRIDSQKIVMDNPMGATLRLSDDGTIAAVGIVDDVWFELPNYVTMYQFKNESWVEIGSQFTGAGRDESANNIVDISNDGSRMVWGGKVNNPTDSLGFIKVYDYTPVLPVRNEILAKSISVYPNPAQNEIKVSIADNNPYKLILFDANGRQIKSINYQNNRTPFSLEDIKNGIYFLNVYDEHFNRVAIKKIVKM